MSQSHIESVSNEHLVRNVSWDCKKVVSGCCRIDVVTKEDALDFLQVEENKQKTNE